MVAGSRVVRQGVVTLANRLAGGQPRAFSTLSLGGLWQQTQAAAAASGQVPAAEPAVAAAGHAWRRVTGLLPSFCDILLAVPKKKVSPHRRGNRNATKFIRWVPVVAQCSKCQRVFQQHQMPSKCEHDECPAYSLRKRPE